MSPSVVLELPFAIYLVLVALFWGSFVNLAADRVPRGESLVTPRSHCRSCGRVLNVIDLLPVAGYFIRGGRCASCQAPIGRSAPIIEAVAGLSMVVPIVALGLGPGAFVGIFLLFGLLVVVVSVSQARHRAGTASGR